MASPKDPNMMTSPLFAFVRAHWYVSIKIVALYMVLYLMIFSFLSEISTCIAVISIISAVAWLFFDYSDIYQKAMRDVNIVKYGYIQYDRFRGLKSGLLSQIPGLIIVILIYITRSSTDYNDIFKLAYFVLYSPVAQTVGSLSLWFWLLPLLIVPIVSHVGYICGYKGLAGNTMNKLFYRSRKKR